MQNESPKTSSVPPSNIESFAKEWIADEIHSRLRQKAKDYAAKGDEASEQERAVAAMVGSIPPDPGPGHPCRDVWLKTVQAIQVYDYYAGQLSMCLLANPAPPLPPVWPV